MISKRSCVDTVWLSSFVLHPDFWVCCVQALALVVGIQAVLVNKIGNGGPECFPVAAQQLLHKRLILIDCAAQHARAFFFLKEQLGRLCVLFPHFTRDKGWVDHYHVEFSQKLLWDVLWLVEIIENEVWILVELLIEL